MKTILFALTLLAFSSGFSSIPRSSAWAQEGDQLSDIERAADEADRTKGILRVDQEDEKFMAEEVAKTQKRIDEIIALEEEKRAKAAAAGTTVTQMENRQIPRKFSQQNTVASETQTRTNGSTNEIAAETAKKAVTPKTAASSQPSTATKITNVPKPDASKTAPTPILVPSVEDANTQKSTPNMIYVKPKQDTPRKLWNEMR